MLLFSIARAASRTDVLGFSTTIRGIRYHLRDMLSSFLRLAVFHFDSRPVQLLKSIDRGQPRSRLAFAPPGTTTTSPPLVSTSSARSSSMSSTYRSPDQLGGLIRRFDRAMPGMTRSASTKSVATRPATAALATSDRSAEPACWDRAVWKLSFSPSRRAR